MKFELRFADLLSGDNYGTHKSRKVKAWLAKNPRFQRHFVPASSSWLNLVTEKRIRRGSLYCVKELVDMECWFREPSSKNECNRTA